MDECNQLGLVADQVDSVVNACLQERLKPEEMAQRVTALLSERHSKWNWTAICGNQYELRSTTHKSHDVVFNKKYPNKLRVVIFRGSPLETLQGGSVNLIVLRNKLPGGEADTKAIQRQVELSVGDQLSMAERIRRYLDDTYPRDNWFVIASEDFAFSHEYEKMACIVFCALVAQLGIGVVKGLMPRCTM